jgi:hypothetical protein
MAPDTPSDLRVLHGLRLAGLEQAERVADRVMLPVPEVEAELAALARRGHAQHRSGRVSGWSLTAEGRAEGERRLAEELDRSGCRSVVEGCYRDFLAVNGALLQVCTDWQLKDEQTLNDHLDPVYDAAVIERLAGIDEAVQPVCARLGACLARFGRYGERLTHAFGRVRAGQTEWFTKPRIASYHTVWFELHEDLLATLNLDRATEGRH